MPMPAMIRRRCTAKIRPKTRRHPCIWHIELDGARWEFGRMGGCCMWPGCVYTVDGFNPCSRTRRNTLPLEQRSAFRMLGIIHPKRGIQRSNDSPSKKPSEKQPSDPPRVKRSQASMRNQIHTSINVFHDALPKQPAGRGSLPSLRSARWVFEVCEALRGSWC